MPRSASPLVPADLWAGLRGELLLGESGSLRAQLIRGSGGVLLLNVASALLSLATGVVLARTLGATGYGIYVLAFAWLELLKVPSVLGLPALVTREVAIYHTREDWARLRGLLIRANQTVLGMALLLMLLAGGASWLLADRLQGSDLLPTFCMALLLLPLFGLTAVRAACLCGLQRVVLGHTPEAVVRPLLALGIIGAIWWLGDDSLSPQLVMAVQIVAVGTAFIVGAVWLLRSLPRQVRKVAPVFETRAWAGSALPFLFMGGLFLINGQTDLIMLGWLSTPADVGIYRIVGIGASLVIFLAAAARTALRPAIARLHTEGDLARLQRLLTRSARTILLLSLPAALPLIFFGAPLLSAIFGATYAAGATALVILVLAQLFGVTMGFVGPLLVMTGYERDAAKAIAVSALINVALNVVLIPIWGMNGAALASAASLVVSNVLLTVLAHRRLNLHCSFLGPVSARGV